MYDVEYTKYNKENYLRIFIDKENGISIEDCENVTKAINDILDDADIIKEQYYLEVSSAGIEKVLKKDIHLEKNIGNKIEVNLYTKYENQKQYQGILQNFNQEKVIIIYKDKEIEFLRKNISQIKEVYEWE